MTGLDAVAKKKAGGFSLGMGQRLGIAAALLGDPQTLILDEPVNGLDPEGVLWVRNLVRYLANQGKTVFLSSPPDERDGPDRGPPDRDRPRQDHRRRPREGHHCRHPPGRTLVRTDRHASSAALLAGNGVTVDQSEPETLEVTGLDPRQIAQVALDNSVLVYELTPQLSSLEDAYFDLTKDEVEYHSHLTGGPAGASSPAAPAPATAGK